jgi:hypothetical protein
MFEKKERQLEKKSDSAKKSLTLSFEIRAGEFLNHRTNNEAT